MKPQEQFEIAKVSKKLWGALFPGLETPSDAQFLLWADIHTPELVSHGINRTARKANVMARQGRPMTLEDTVKYAASVMNNESKGLRRFESGITPKTIHSVTATDDDNRGNRL